MSTPRIAAFSLALLVACPNSPDTGDTDDGGTDLPDVLCDQRDDDSDGVNACDDCDDSRPEAFPGAPEQCNGLDDDCDGEPLADEADGNEDGLPDCWACEEAGYWDIVRDTSDGALDDALADEMSGLRCAYSETATWMFTRLDNEASTVECVYTGRTTTVVGTRPDPNNDMNVEHTWPQSQGADVSPMKCDLHHLFPTDVDANQARGNLPFGEVARNVDFSEGGSRRGDDSGGDEVFEPRDEHKGNVARAMLYMSLEYGWTLPSDQRALFVRWNSEDPVDADEIERTLDIAEHQSFANPLVTCPGVVERLY